jgi:hypothetical protein
MKKTALYIAWFCLFLATVIFGSVEPGSKGMKIVMIALSVAFFIPPGILMYQGISRGDRAQVVLLRKISLISLAATFVLLVANFLSASASQQVGDVLYAVLIIVSAPMVCSRFWIISLFAWACILMTSLMYCPKKK